MPSVFDWSSTAASNTTIDGVNIAEGCPSGNLNNAVRSAMAIIRATFASGLQSFLAGSAALPVANGGTALTATPANGQLAIGNGTNYTLANITAGSGVSVTNGAGTITIAATGSGGTVSSVAVSGGTTGLTTSGGPVTGSGTITLGGTLAVASGGTGAGNASSARSNLGAAARGNNSDITQLSGLTTALSVAQGGTGATTAGGALTSLGALGVSSSTLASTGSIVLSNGLCFKWGTVFVGADSSASVTFASAFSTALFNVQISWQDTIVGSGSGQGASGIASPSASGFSIYNDGSGRTHYWFAIGN